MKNRQYEKTVAFMLHIINTNGEITKEFLQDVMILPKSKKQYRVTKKNVLLYVQESIEVNPSIEKVQIDRISAVCTIRSKKSS